MLEASKAFFIRKRYPGKQVETANREAEQRTAELYQGSRRSLIWHGKGIRLLKTQSFSAIGKIGQKVRSKR